MRYHLIKKSLTLLMKVVYHQVGSESLINHVTSKNQF